MPLLELVDPDGTMDGTADWERFRWGSGDWAENRSRVDFERILKLALPPGCWRWHDPEQGFWYRSPVPGVRLAELFLVAWTPNVKTWAHLQEAFRATLRRPVEELQAEAVLRMLER